jgi:hypothetical protein
MELLFGCLVGQFTWHTGDMEVKMDNIRKLPFFAGSFIAVVTGFISYVYGADSRTIYIRMAVMMVVFFVSGVFIKNTVTAIKDEVNNKKEKELREMEREEELENVAEIQNGVQNENNREHMVNLVADDSDEDFSPLTVSRIITSKTKE